MDEVDKIILSSLSEIGYVTKDNITNLKLYTFEQQVSMVTCCLRAIRPDMGFPPSLPPSMSARYTVCAQFAQICKELGYKKDVGFHTFMYQNSNDIRQVLIFLVEHLPKKTSFEQPNESKTRDITIRQRISEELKNIFATEAAKSESNGSCTAPFASAFLETGTLLPNQKIDCKPLEWRNFVAQELPFIDEQLPDSRCFLPSVIALNASGLVNPTKQKCSKFSSSSLDHSFYRALSSSTDSCNYETYSSRSAENTSEAQALPRSGELAVSDTVAVEADQRKAQSAPQSEEAGVVLDLETEIEETKLQVTALSAKLSEISQCNDTLKRKLKEKMSHESSLQQSIALLPDSENNIPKLEAANEKCRAKILNVESQWSRHKDLLLNKRAELRKAMKLKTTEKNQLIQSLTESRNELFDLMEEVQKRSLVEQRLSEFDLSGSAPRSDYINRILEIIKNLDKQREQIANILKDMRYIQKEINNLSGKVGRSFAVVEKLVATQSSPADEVLSRETHQMVFQLHKEIEDTLNMVEETGKYAREIKDLDDQLMESGTHAEEALRQVTVDLTRLRDEQATLLSEIAKYISVDGVAEVPQTTAAKKSPPSAKSAVKSAEAEPRRSKTRSKDKETQLEIILPLFSRAAPADLSSESSSDDNANPKSRTGSRTVCPEPEPKASTSGTTVDGSGVPRAVEAGDASDDST